MSQSIASIKPINPAAHEGAVCRSRTGRLNSLQFAGCAGLHPSGGPLPRAWAPGHRHGHPMCNRSLHL